jgi:radical SAM protein with 4Fe4S-binding SPASM domain
MLAPPEQGFSDGLWCAIGKTAVVAANGDVFPCSLMMEEPFRLGNICRNGLMDIFRSEKMKEFCGLPDRRRTETPECEICPWRGFCQAGCPGLALDHTGSVRGKDRFCEFRKRAYRDAFDGILERHASGELAGTDRIGSDTSSGEGSVP